jgi:hypothetical protein
MNPLQLWIQLAEQWQKFWADMVILWDRSTTVEGFAYSQGCGVKTTSSWLIYSSHARANALKRSPGDKRHVTSSKIMIASMAMSPSAAFVQWAFGTSLCTGGTLAEWLHYTRPPVGDDIALRGRRLLRASRALFNK